MTGSAVTTAGTSMYCFENTMQADQQMNGYSTSILVEAEYTPKNVTKGASYFVYHQKLYKDIAALEAGLKAKYLAQQELETLATNYQYASWSDLKIQNKASLRLRPLKVGAKLDPAKDILYYKKGLNYYTQVIKHDDAIAQNALGRWGVVRNTFYAITLNSVNGFGTPIITVPDPTIPDDKEGWLGVQIIVNPWTMKEQGVDFE